MAKEQEAKATGTDGTEGSVVEKKLFVEREEFTSKGKQYFGYVVKGMIRGRDIKVDFVPPDKGGYEVLDLVFFGAPNVELVMVPFEFKDDSGKTISGTNYEVQSIDSDGVVYKSAIKPARSSDKSLLDMLLSQLLKVR
jgi:hypothetical protein